MLGAFGIALWLIILAATGFVLYQLVKSALFLYKTARIIKWMRRNPELNKLLVFLENQLAQPAERFITPSPINKWVFQGGSHPVVGVPYGSISLYGGGDQKFDFAHEIGHFLYFKKIREEWEITQGCSFGKKRWRGIEILSCFWDELTAWEEARKVLENQGLLADSEKSAFNNAKAAGLKPNNYPTCLKAIANKECPLSCLQKGQT